MNIIQMIVARLAEMFRLAELYKKPELCPKCGTRLNLELRKSGFFLRMCPSCRWNNLKWHCIKCSSNLVKDETVPLGSYYRQHPACGGTVIRMAIQSDCGCEEEKA